MQRVSSRGREKELTCAPLRARNKEHSVYGRKRSGQANFILVFER
jgi:hypothetical protein